MKTTNRSLAKRYHCTVKTISRWRSQGAPLANPKALRAWIADHKNIPPDSAPPAGAPGKPLPEGTGAGLALRRLEQAEAEAAAAFELAAKKGDPLAMRSARTNWLGIVESLRKLHRSVDLADRIQGSTVSREAVEQALRTVGYWWSAARYEAASAIAEHARHGEMVTRELTRRLLSECWVKAIAASRTSTLPLPAWMVGPLTATAEISDAPAQVAADVETITELLKFCVPAVARQIAEQLKQK